MEFMAHFKYDKKINLWLSSFMARALPGILQPREVAYSLYPGSPMLDAESYQLFMTIDLGDGQVDIGVKMTVRSSNFLTGAAPTFEDPEITRDVQDADGAHLRTLVWNDLEGRWFDVDDPLAGLSVLDGGLSQRQSPYA